MSSTLIQKNNPQEISPAGARIVQQLSNARRKLLNKEVPNRLKMVAYLRLSCSASMKYKKMNSSLGKQIHKGIHFYTLLRVLSEHDASWWEKCFVTESGILDSCDSILHVLLSPLAQLHIFQYSSQI